MTTVPMTHQADSWPFIQAPLSDSDFRLLFTQHPIPMWLYDPVSLQFLLMNDAVIEFYGYSAEQMANMTMLDIRPECEYERMYAAIQANHDFGKPQIWKHLKASGEIVEVATYGRRTIFNGKPAILVIIQDQTEIAKARNEINHTRSLLDSLIKNLPLGIFIKDMQDDGRYILFNEAASSITGKTVNNIIGKKDDQIFSAEDAGNFIRQDLHVMANDNTLTVENEIILQDHVRHVRVMKRTIPVQNGEKPRYLIGLMEDITEEQALQAHLTYTAMHDALTNLPNRVYFSHHTADLFAANDPRQGYALLFLDVDHFKLINDSIGHAAGDELLCQVARRLSAFLPKKDFIARLGGDEFAIVHPFDAHNPAHRQEISRFAEDITELFRQPFHLEGNPEYVGCTIGVVLAPYDGTDIDTLLRNADLALYAAKADQRGIYRFYEKSMREAVEKRHRIATELHQALQNNEFLLFYQPIFSLTTDQITGCEALLRWQHPTRGLVTPDDFIPIAEDTGIISAIGAWVLQQACTDAMKWPEHIKVSVNLSAVQFNGRGMLDMVKSALDNSGLPADRLELEITETVLLSNTEQNTALLLELRKLGVRIAMDDFGTGYSSLNYLRTFPFDKIKIDRSFVSDIDNDKRNLAIIQAVVSLGSAFNIVTTAEGVETPEQLARLKREHFGEVQGFFTGKPMPQPEVCAFIFGHAH
ncbi:MAG: EAL domain-containing protein [Brucellaceae bacterium]|nr:EAL domain-containing protein [Brucellaceae bacterium]